jgi:hypothetical protein
MTEQRLRTALRELGDLPAPGDLASGALARARRDRRRTGVVLAAVVVLATAAAILVPATLRTRADAPPATPAPAVWVSWYRMLAPTAAGVTESQDYFYDAARRGYRPVPAAGTARIASLSPDGTRAVVAQGRVGAERRMAIVGLDRLAAGLAEADWSVGSIPTSRWTWSPEGTRLLSTDAVGQPSEARVLDAGTRKVTRAPLRLDEMRSGGHAVTWGPGGRGFVAWRWAPLADRPAPGELILLDGAGRPTRRYPLPTVADLVRLSPDGTRALLVTFDPGGTDGRRNQTRLLDLGSGTTAAIGTGPEQWYDERNLVRVEAPASGPSAIILVDAGTGRPVRRSAPAAAGAGQITEIMLARGVPPPGAIVP